MSGLSSFAEYVAWLARYYLAPMVANALPVLVKGSLLVDGGKLFIDGKPIFGQNKTWEGLLLGIAGSYVAGSCVGVLFGDHTLALLALGAGLSALLGDLLGAFIKRRLGIRPGNPAPILDQWDFALATTAYYYALSVKEVLSHPLYIILTLILIFVLHISTNIAAYALGLKRSKL